MRRPVGGATRREPTNSDIKNGLSKFEAIAQLSCSTVELQLTKMMMKLPILACAEKLET